LPAGKEGRRFLAALPFWSPLRLLLNDAGDVACTGLGNHGGVEAAGCCYACDVARTDALADDGAVA